MSFRRRSSPWRVPPFVALAVLGHGVAYLVLSLSGVTCAPKGTVPTPLPMPVEVTPIDLTVLEPQPLNPFGLSPSEEEQRREVEKKLAEARKEEQNPDLSGQVVEIAKPRVEVRPDDARFLAEYDSKVEKETRGRPSLTPGVAATPPPPETRPEPSQPARPSSPPASGSRGAGALAMRTETGTGSRRVPSLSPGGSSEGLEAEGEDALGPPRGEGDRPGESPPEAEGGGDGRPLPGPLDLRPNSRALQQAIGGTGSPDYLKDVDEGAETLLNTKRWKYAGFFNRVKRAVAQNWHPDQAYRLRDPTGQIYGTKDRLTILKVSLHPNGSIRDILIEKPCGVDFLDDEAVQAFRAAEPFPNPPAGLIDQESQLITFRFGFYFEISEGTKFKVFRYSN